MLVYRTILCSSMFSDIQLNAQLPQLTLFQPPPLKPEHLLCLHHLVSITNKSALIKLSVSLYDGMKGVDLYDTGGKLRAPALQQLVSSAPPNVVCSPGNLSRGLHTATCTL